MLKFGFIGVGNMGGALARAVVSSVGADNVILSDKSLTSAEILAKELRCSFGNNEDVIKLADFIFLGVKPQILKYLIEDLKPLLENSKKRIVFVSMAAGVKINDISAMFQKDYPIIRIMPNTPVRVGKGMIQYCTNSSVFMDEIGEFCNALINAGKVDKLDEVLIDAASAVSGCGPAFAYMFAEALADAGVECGLPRDKALEYASQMMAGASELLLSSKKHPGVLKDEVCSPSGSTIAGVHALEENGFRGAVMDAVKSSFNRTKELGK